MDAKTFLDEFGVDEARVICDKAGTNYAYFSQIAHGHRRPSVELAEKLVEASKERLDFVSLMQSKKRQAA